MKKAAGPFWAARVVLAVSGVLLILAAIGVRLSISETTETTETTIAQPSPSAALHPASSPAATTIKTTTTRAAGSDTYTLGLLTLGVFLGLAAVFYDRITKLTGPGGFGFELTPGDQAAAPQKVAEIIAKRASKRPPGIGSGHPMFAAYSLVEMATETGGNELGDVTASVQGTATQAGRATSLALSYAATLHRLAVQSPADVSEVALAWGIPRSEIGDLVAGRITDEAWSAIAERAVDQVSRS